MSSHVQSSLLKASVVSGLVGALFALVLAPRSGRETRRQLRRAARELLHRERFVASEETPEERMAAALRDEQEQMRMKRESRRQMPVLNSWEREL
jgi:hypothetical protein